MSQVAAPGASLVDYSSAIRLPAVSLMEPFATALGHQKSVETRDKDLLRRFSGQFVAVRRGKTAWPGATAPTFREPITPSPDGRVFRIVLVGPTYRTKQRLM